MNGKYQVMPALSPEEYAELEADILNRGVQVPIEFDEEGNVLDGFHRLRICQEHGLGYPSIIRQGMTEEEKVDHAWKLNLARRHLTREQRQQLALRFRQEGQSIRQIADTMGVPKSTIALTLSTVPNGTVDLRTRYRGSLLPRW